MPSGNGHVNNLTLPHWYYPFKLKGLSGIYLNTAIRNFAEGLISVFIPIYVYKLTGQFSFVFLYYTIFYLTIVIATLPVSKLISKTGPDFLMFISGITRSAYFVVLTMSIASPNLLWLAPILGGITTPLYWLSYHSAFASKFQNGRLCRQVSNLSSITRLVSILAPLIGGFIAVRFGFQTLFPIGVVLMIASSLPIFFDEYNRKERVAPVALIKENIFSPPKRKLFASFFFQGFETIANSIGWPLILFLFVPNLEQIGELTTVTLFLSLLIVNWLGRKLKDFEIKPLVGSSLAAILTWIVRGLTFNPLFLIAGELVLQLAAPFFVIPYDTLIYKEGRKRPLSFFTEREIVLHSGTTFFCFLIFVFLSLGLSWRIIALLTVLGIGLGTQLLVKHVYSCKTKSV